jgi:hypothetical protein
MSDKDHHDGQNSRPERSLAKHTAEVSNGENGQLGELETALTNHCLTLIRLLKSDREITTEVRNLPYRETKQALDRESKREAGRTKRCPLADGESPRPRKPTYLGKARGENSALNL